MTAKEYAKIVASNLRRLAFAKEKTQIEMAKDLGVNQSTISNWMNGTRTPKMDKIDQMCEYFGCSRNDIMNPHGSNFEYVGEINPLSAEEIQIARAYNVADDSIRRAVKILLGLEGK